MSSLSPVSRPANVKAYTALLISFMMLMSPIAPAASASAGRVVTSGSSRNAAVPVGAQPAAPNVTATKTDTFADPDNDGKAEPGDTISYEVTIGVSGMDATGVQFTDTIDLNSTLVPGSVTASPLARADSYAATLNTPLNINAAQGVLANDFGLPAPTATAIAAGLTTGGGTVTLNTDGSFIYTPANNFQGSDTFTYTAVNGNTPSDTATVTISVDAAPTVTATTPANGATQVANNANVSVSFSEDVTAPASAFTISCATSGSHAFALSGGPSAFTLNPTVDFTNGELCTVTVSAAGVADTDTNDPPDNMAANYVFSFTVDTPPTVSTTTPANGATGVANNADITVTFDEAVTAASNAFTVSCATTGAHTFVLSGGPTTFTLSPDTDFSANGEICTVTVVAANVTDNDTGDPPDNMAANYVFSFTVDAGPTVVATTPANGAAQVANNTNVTITFSEAVNVTGEWFSFNCATSGTLGTSAFTVTPNGTNTVFTLDKTTDYANSELCTVTVVAAQVADQDSGDPPDNLAANYVFSFTIDTPPSVTTTTPANGAIDVAENANVVVNFSETVNVTTGSFTLECPSGSPKTFAVSGSGTSTVTLDPTADLPPGVICTVTVVANQVSDTDAGDPPNNLEANYVFSFGVKPRAVDDSRNATGNIRIQTAGAGRSGFTVLTNDIGPGLAVTAFDATSARGGNVSVAADGTLSYNPPPGYEGADSFNYTISNNAGSDVGTVSITIAGMIWFINNGAVGCTTVSAATGCGRLTNPLSTLASFDAVNGNADVPASNIYNPAADDHIFIYTGSGNYTAPLTLENNQRVVGQGATATLTSITGVVPVADSDLLPGTGGTNPTITSGGNGIVLAQNNTLRGLTIGNTVGPKISGNNFGTLTAGDSTLPDLLLNGSGQALGLTSGTFAATSRFNSVTTTSSAAAGISLTTVGGAVNFGNTSVSASSGTGVSLTTNSATLTFADLDIAPNSGQRGLHAVDNSGTITITSGTISAPNSSAVTITRSTSTTPLNVVLTSVTSVGGTLPGIALTNTSGSFAVTAGGSTDACTSAATCDGGSISGKTGNSETTGTPGVRIVNATNFRLIRVNISGNNHSGILGGNVSGVGLPDTTVLNGFQLDSCNITGNGDQAVSNPDEGGVVLYNLVGTAAAGANPTSIINSTLTNNREGQVTVTNNSATALTSLNMSGNTISSNGAGTVSNLLTFNVPVGGSANMTLNLTSGTFTGAAPNTASGIQCDHSGTGGTLNCNVSGATFTNNNVAIEGGVANAGNLNFIFQSNTATGTRSHGLNFFANASSTGTVNGKFLNNTVGTLGSVGSGSAIGNGIRVQNESQQNAGALNVLISGNTVQEVATQTAVAVNQGITGSGDIDSKPTNATITNNIIREIDDGRAIIVSYNDNDSGATGTTCADVSGNEMNNITGQVGDGTKLRFRQLESSTFFLRQTNAAGAATANSPPNGVATTTTTTAQVSIGGTMTATSGCTQPTNTSAPLSFEETGAANEQAGAESIETNQPEGDMAPVAAEAARAADAPVPARVWSDMPVSDSTRSTASAQGDDENTSVEKQAAGQSLRQTAARIGTRDVAYVGPLGTAPAPRFARASYSAGDAVRASRATAAAAPPTRVLPTKPSLKAVPARAVSPAPAPFSGETVNVNIGTFPAGKSVKVRFQVTVNNPFPGTATQVSNQGTVTADGGISVLTDDPSEPGATDPTVTLVSNPPGIKINDAKVVEPSSGTANALFTLVLTHAFGSDVTVDFSTADPAGPNNATAGSDYTTTNVTVTFAAGETFKTVSVPVLADGSGESDETFLVNLSNPNGAEISDAQAVGTITETRAPGSVLISELRTSGPAGMGDDFVELYNNGDSPVDISGWSLVKSAVVCNGAPVVIATIPSGTSIPARGNYLLTGSAYSLAGYGGANLAIGDRSLASDIEADRNVALFNTSDPSSFGSTTVVDSVGFGLNIGDNCDLLREGANLAGAADSLSEYSFVRKVEKGRTEDTGDNASDFVVVSTTPAAPVGNNTTPTLGAPGPENSTSPRGPKPCGPNAVYEIGRALLDDTAGASASPNRVRDNTAGPAATSSLGTVSFRRRFTNNTGGNLTRLRLRVVDLTGTADLRLLTSSDVVVSGIQDTATCSTTGTPTTVPCQVTVRGTTVEDPPAQPNGGGVNSTFAVSLGSPLTDNQSLDLQFLFGVQQTGNYHLHFVVETLSSNGVIGQDVWELRGHTENGGDTDGACNAAPLANAGTDQTVECGSAVTFTGSATDEENDTPFTFEWFEGDTSLGTGETLSGVVLPFGSHTITLKVKDAQQSVGTDEVLVNVVDTTAPQTTITDNPTNPSGTSVNFSFTGDDGASCSGVAGFECQLDGGGFSACTSPQGYTGLSDGSHTFQVRAVDAQGNADATPASYTWTVDAAGPDTTIDTSPSNPSNSSSASFTFSSEAGAGFECKLDSGTFAPCTSPQSYTGLSDGSHTFQVRATDGFGNVDPSPASFMWTVDTTAPDTTIITNPLNPSGANVSFTFSGTDAGTGVAGFECKLDGGAFASCTSSQGYSGLSDGSHTFQVRAVDGAGNTDAIPASYTWTVDATAPDTTINSNPANPTSSTSAGFSFTSSEVGGSFECKLDSGAFAPCTSPQNYSSLSDGSHTFQVRAVDAVGNVDPSPASFTWLVDTTAPDTTITGPPPPVTDGNPSFTFNGSDAGSGVASFECQLDGGGFAPCTSPKSYSGLSAGSHTFQVRAIDAVGNVDATPASHTWTVVLNSPPTVSVARGGQCVGGGTTGTMNLFVADPDNDALTITRTSSNTTVVPVANIVFGGSGANRTVTITAVDKKSGFSDVTITVSDGKAPPVQVVIRVIVGTNKNETINGTPGADMIFGMNGDDTVNAGGGNDLVCGGNGVGAVNGGAGDDTIDGANGNDILRGEDGDDILLGGGGNDRLEGGNNNDTMTGGMGADAFIGGAGSDTATDFTPSQGDTKDGTTEVSSAFPLLRGNEAFGYLASWSLWGVDPYAGAGTPLGYFLTGRGPVIVPTQ